MKWILALALICIVVADASAQTTTIFVNARTPRHGLIWRLTHRPSPATVVRSTTTTVSAVRPVLTSPLPMPPVKK